MKNEFTRFFYQNIPALCLGDRRIRKTGCPPCSRNLPSALVLNRLKVHRCLTSGKCSIGSTYPGLRRDIYLNERLTFTFDPLFHAGCYYVQEASSMFVEQVLRQHVTEAGGDARPLCRSGREIDPCFVVCLPEGSLLVANEVIRNRSQILAENLTKWGHPDVVVTNNDPADFSAVAFISLTLF